MHTKLLCRRLNKLAVVVLSLFLMGAILVTNAGAEEALTVDELSVNKQSIYPGETVRVTVKWTNNTGYNVAATLICTNGNVAAYERPLTMDASGLAQIDIPIDLSASRNSYNIKVITGNQVLGELAGAFTVNEIITLGNVTSVSPSELSPVEVFAGDTVRVSIRYTSPANTSAVIGVGNSASGSVEIRKTNTSRIDHADLTIPANTPAGDYNLNISFLGSSYQMTEIKAVRVKVKPIVVSNITSPTKSSPVTVRPGDNVTIRYSYSVSSDTPVSVRLVSGSNSLLVGRDVTLSRSSTSGSTMLTVPTSAAVGKYNVVILPKDGGAALVTQQEAVLVEQRITADITSPTRSKPVSVAGGEKFTVTFDYTADARSNVEVRIQKSDSDVLLTSTVALDRSTSIKQKSVTITIPSGASQDKYNLVIRSSVSGNTLDTERDAVNVEAKITADITSPTRARPATVSAGDTLQVKFDYTSGAASNVDVKVLKKDGSALVTASTSLDKTSTKKSKTVSVRIPTGAAAGKYDLVVAYKNSDKVLDNQTQAVVIEEQLVLKVTSPTQNGPARINTTGKVEVMYNYTAETSSDVEFRLLKPDGKILVRTTQYLSRTSTNRTGKVELSLPTTTQAASYDLEVVNKDTENRLALEQKAVIVGSYKANMQLKFVIGQNGRWVNGTYQHTDLDARIIHGRTMLPIRHVGEPLGWELKWDETNKMATIIKGDRQVRVWVNYSSGQVSTNNGNTWQTVRIDPDNASVQPLIISGRVLLPLRFVSEALDTMVDWDATNRTVTVSQD